jgi:hypothetical protein
MKRANFGLPLGAMGSSMSLEYKVKAYCFNSDCSSCKARLSFYLQTGSNSVNESNRSLTIHAGDKKYHWNYGNFHDIRHSAPSQGLLLAVVLKKSELKKIAKSKDVHGKIAGYRFKWSYKNRKPARTLLKKLKRGFEKPLIIKLSLTQRVALGTSEAKQSPFIAGKGRSLSRLFGIRDDN